VLLRAFFIGGIMAKDPAFLFYYQDFLVGTEFMSDEDIGKYIRILCHLADKDELSEKQVLNICKASVIPEEILGKLTKNGNGTYYNEKLREVVDKRRKFTESRRENAAKKKHKPNTSKSSVKHVENKSEKENVNFAKIIKHLNKKAGTKYRLGERTKTLLGARLKEYSFEDILNVIDKKYDEWKNSEMEKYLRPETLFNATKFESYYNQKIIKPTKPNTDVAYDHYKQVKKRYPDTLDSEILRVMASDFNREIIYALMAQIGMDKLTGKYSERTLQEVEKYG